MILEMNEKWTKSNQYSNKSQYDGRVNLGQRLLTANSFTSSGNEFSARPGAKIRGSTPI
jgi:hypothetical protein